MNYLFPMNNPPVIKELVSAEEASKSEGHANVTLNNILEVNGIQQEPMTPSRTISCSAKSIDAKSVTFKSRCKKPSTHPSTEREKQIRKCSCYDCRGSKSSLSDIAKQAHDEGNKYSCKICQVTFLKETLLELHKKQHETRPFVCSACNDAFADQHALKVHQKRHSHAAVHKCDKCNATFTTLSQIEIHKRVHIQERQFSCEFCGAAFLKKSGLSQHLRAKPMIQNLDRHIPELVCVNCELTFISNCGKVKHGEVYHPQQCVFKEDRSPGEVVKVYYLDIASIFNGNFEQKKVIKQEEGSSSFEGMWKDIPPHLGVTQGTINRKRIKEEVEPFIPNNSSSLEEGKYKGNSVNYENSGLWNITNL